MSTTEFILPLVLRDAIRKPLDPLGKRSAYGTFDRANNSTLCDHYMPQVKLYTRENCHLCDEAYAILTRNGLLPESIDIDADSELHSQFTECVPVVEIDGKIRFRGIVNEILLRRLLR